MQVSLDSTKKSKQESLDQEFPDLIKPAIVLFVLGMALAFLLIKAFSTQDAELLKAKFARDQVVAEKVIDNCIVFSTLSSEYDTSGTLRVTCTVDLNYFRAIENMRKRAESFKRELRQKPKLKPAA